MKYANALSSETDQRVVSSILGQYMTTEVMSVALPALRRGDIGFRREWIREWYGRDLDVLLVLEALGYSNKQPYDAVVVGAGVVGLCFARDLASLGYRVAIIERRASIGGVWSENDYPGLRLHGPGAVYRSLSLAP